MIRAVYPQRCPLLPMTEATAQLAMQIRQARLVIVDVETTGLNPNRSRIIEIAALAVQEGAVRDTFHSLIDPQCLLPRHIQRLTGIRQPDLDLAPVAGEVMPQFLEFLSNSIFTAHNVTFDWNMVHGELNRLDQPELSNPKLCTVRLARRLLPELPSKSLGKLVQFYGLDAGGLHRALKDAHMTAAILERLLKRLQSAHDISEVDAVLRFQHKSYAKAKPPTRAMIRIRSKVLPNVPPEPGIYQMESKSGSILYIGRSRNLQQRVRSYFAGIEGHPAHTRKLVRATCGISWQTTGTELEAILLESRQIKTHKPRFNRAAVDYPRRSLLRVGLIRNSPWVTVVQYARNDGASYFGPLGSRMAAETLAMMLVRIYGHPRAAPRPSERAAGVGLAAARIGGRLTEDGLARARAFLTGDREDVLPKLEAGMRRASSRQKYELAGEYRNWLTLVEALPPTGEFECRSIPDRQGVALIDNGAQVELHSFCQGCPISTQLLPPTGRLPSGAVDDLFRAIAAPRERLMRQHMNELSLFAQWLRQAAPEVRLVWLDPGAERAAFERALRQTLRSMRSNERGSVK